MEKRGPDPFALLVVLVVLLALGVFLWLIISTQNIAGEAHLAPPAYGEFAAESFCDNPALEAMDPLDARQRCLDRKDVPASEENAP